MYNNTHYSLRHYVKVRG